MPEPIRLPVRVYLGDFDPQRCQEIVDSTGRVVDLGDVAAALNAAPLPAFVPAAVEAHDAEIRAHDAGEVAGLREAMADLLRYPQTVYVGWAKTRFETTVEQDIAQRWQSLLSDPSPSVQRIEAEARLGRAALNLVRAEHDTDTSVGLATYESAWTEHNAALAELRALDGGAS